MGGVVGRGDGNRGHAVVSQVHIRHADMWRMHACIHSDAARLIVVARVVLVGISMAASDVPLPMSMPVPNVVAWCVLSMLLIARMYSID